MPGNVWFISGATSGFGKHIALEALSRGDSVIATSRTATTKLGELAAKGALLLDLDVTAPDAAIEAALQQAKARFGRITHFINAAGYILEGPIEGASQSDVLKTFNTNVLGIISLTRHEVALLRKQGSGGVIANFGSLGSWIGGAAFANYAATKWAVSGFTESLHDEVKEFGISGIIIEPGYFRTGFLNEGAGGDGGSHRMVVSNPLTEEYRGTAVEQVRKALAHVNNNQPGDVIKGSRVIVDVLTKTGTAQGREIPMRLLLGRDVFQTVREKLRQTEALLNEWEDIAANTEHDDVKKA